MTVYGFKDPQTTTSQFEKPAAGNRYVSVDVQVANRASSQQTFSSLVSLHLVDGANRQYDMKITTVEPRAPCLPDVLPVLALWRADARPLPGSRAGGVPWCVRLRPEGGVTAQPDVRQLRDLIGELGAIVEAFDAGIVDRATGKRWSLTAEQLMARAKASARAETTGAGGGGPRYAADGSRPGSTPAWRSASARSAGRGTSGSSTSRWR